MILFLVRKNGQNTGSVRFVLFKVKTESDAVTTTVSNHLDYYINQLFLKQTSLI